MHRISSKRVLAVALAFALLLCCLPATYAMADFVSENLLETKIDMVNSKRVMFTHSNLTVAETTAGQVPEAALAGLVDGNTTDHYDIGSYSATDSRWFGIEYALDDTYFASHITFFADYSDLPACYHIYASDSLDGLYRTVNLVAEVTMNGNSVDLTVNRPVRYVALVFNPTVAGTDARPKEIELWSGDAENTFVASCLSDSDPSKLVSYSIVAVVPSTMSTTAHNTSNQSAKLAHYQTNISTDKRDIYKYGDNYTALQYQFDSLYYIGDICIDSGVWNYDETWDVYASTSLADLYTAGSKVATVDCKSSVGGRVSINTYATFIGLVQTTGDARIRGIRIYSADGTGVPEPFVAENILRTDTGLTATPFWQLISTGAVTDDTGYNYPVTAERFAAYTDGDTSTHKDMRNFTIGTYRVGARYELSAPAYIGDILVYASIGASYPEIYSVYASSSIDTLLDDSNRLVTSEETTGAAITASVNGYVQYIAFVCESYTGNPRFREIEAWTAEAPAAPVVFTPENVLANNVTSARCVQFYPTSHYVGDASQISAETIGHLTDGNTTDTHDCSTALDWNPPRYLGVEYTLDDTYFVGSLKIYSGYTTSIDTFDVYASDSIDTLYDDVNRVAHKLDCDNTGAQIITVNKDVRYITFLISGIELYCARIAEFEAWTAEEAEVAAPAFGSHSLVLTDAIGVNFFMNLDALTAEEKAASYVTFDIKNGERKTVSFDGDFTGNGGTYGFTCFVSSVQMAEAITPTFHYGDKTTLAGVSYSVKDYIDYVNANSGSFEAEVVTLVKAIGDYGHYAQDYLGAKNGWTAGEDYTALAKYRAADYGSDDYNNAANELSENGKVASPTGTASGAAAGQYQFALNFDSTTSLVIKINNNDAATANSDYDGSVERDAADGSLLFYLLKMPVTKLGNIYSVSGSIDSNPYSIDICGLSYVYGIINSGSASDAAKKAVCSLYDYYKAAIAYQATLS